MFTNGIDKLQQDTGCDPEIATQFLKDCLLTKSLARTLLGGGLHHEIPTDYQVKFLHKYLEQRLGSGVKYDEELKRFVMLNGEKVTKYAKRNMDSLDLDEGKLCALGDLVKVRTLIITSSPLDMIYASEEAAFSTCYHFEGQYASSVLAMAQTPNMLMAYMTDKTADDLGVIDYRHGRCWLHIEDEIVTTFKAYGALRAAHKKLIREYVQDIISESTTRWRVKHGVSCEGCDDCLAYVDDADVSVYVVDNRAHYSLEHIEFPTEAVCLRCGVSYAGRRFFCKDCSVFCEVCGDVIVSNAGITQGLPVCDYCGEG